MFSGVIETLGRVEALQPKKHGALLALRPDEELDISIGESLCVSGVCLSVAGRAGEILEFDLSAETLACTTLGSLQSGDRLNLEPALRLGDRLGGHLVMGHVDAVGVVCAVERAGDGAVMEFSAASELIRLVAPKGSVAVDGVSLTSIQPGRDSFRVALVPSTLARSTLGLRIPGDRVNLEADSVARYLDHLLSRRAA